MKPKEKSLKQGKKQLGSKINAKDQPETNQKQTPREKQQMQQKQKKNAKEQIENPIKVVLEIDASLAPINQNVALLGSLQQYETNSLRLIELYRKLRMDIIIQPLSYAIKESKNKLVFMKKGLKTLKEEQLKIDSQFIFAWLVEICYKLHPTILKLQKDLYLKIQKTQVYVGETPFMPSIMLRQEIFKQINPLKIILLDEVKDQLQYFTQMIEFDERFKAIKDVSALQKLYFNQRQQKYSQNFTIHSLCSKIKEKHLLNSLNQDKPQISQILDQGVIRWAMQQIGLENSLRPYVFFKVSQCCFEPQEFWSKISNISKGQHKGQLLVLEIDSTPSKLVGFYSTLMGNLDLNLVKSPFPSYIKDGSKKSLLINFSQRVVHPLAQKQFGFAVGREFLICIGKCDIVLSAFNLSNLCYFPTSFEPDSKMLSATAESLCGSKRFGLKQLYVYRFENLKQKP